MAYSQDYTQIESGLINYIGAAMQAVPVENQKSKAQYIIGALMKQIVLLSDPENTFDLYIYKPVIRSLMYIFEQSIESMQKDKPYTNTTIKKYQSAIDSLQQILNLSKTE